MTQPNTLALSSVELQPAPSTLRRSSLLRMMLPMPVFCWHSTACDERKRIETYIADRFRSEYDARVSTFAPVLLSMRCKGELSAAVGVRPAQTTPLFIEQYLYNPIEHCIESSNDEPVRRDQIVEISNLVATRRGASQLLFIVIGSVMYEAGYRWLAFSATDKVERITRKFPFPVQVLCASDPGRLGKRAGQWGRYYETSPKVIVGDIKVAYQKAQSNHLLRMALRFYRPLLRRLVSTLPQVR